MRLNLWLVFRLHWTQSEPIKHMSIMSFWDMGSWKIYGSMVGTFVKEMVCFWFHGPQIWPELFLRMTLCGHWENHWTHHLCQIFLIISVINLQDVCIVRPYSFGHDSCTISPKRCYIIACSSTLHGDFLHWLVRGLFYCHTQSGRIAQGRSYFFKLKPITYISHHESSSRSVLQFKRTFIWPTVNV